jgi:hypothetical protein
MTENFDSNVTATEAEQNTNQQVDGKAVNAGAIRKSTTSSILNALSQASGQNFESVEAAIGYIARTASSQQSVGNVQPVESEPTVQTRMGREVGDDTTDLRDQFMRLQRDLAQKERALRAKELDSEILRNMGDRFDPDLQDYALQKIKSNLSFKRDGSFAIVNSKNQERYGMDGNPLTIAALIEEVAQGNPKLLKQNNLSNGSGLRPGQQSFAGATPDAIPDYSKDPAAFNAWASKMGLGKRVGLKSAGVTATVSTASRKIV